MAEIAFYISVIAIAAIVGSLLSLIVARPDRSKTKHLEEIAPDAKYGVRLQKVVVATSVTAGLTASILLPLIGSRSIQNAPLVTVVTVSTHIVSWAYITILSALLIIATRHNVIFHLACHLAILAVLKSGLSLVLCSDDIYPLVGRLPIGAILKTADVISGLLSTVSAFALLSAVVTIPRAPQLEYRDIKVNSIAFATLWSQFFFTYSDRIQKIARKNASLEQSDLDALPYGWRASVLLSKFAETRTQNMSFLRRLWTAFKGPLIFQWTAAVAQAFLMYAPAFFLLRILSFIEHYKRSAENGHHVPIYEGLGYVLGMFVVKQISAFNQSQLWFVSAAVLQVNTRAAINLEIYDKTLKKQNTVGGISDDVKDKDDSKAESDKKEEEGTEAGTLATSKQNVLNLMTVDSDRISTFFVFNFFGIQAPCEILISLTFLYQLLGWASIPGFAVMCLFIPLTSKISSLYSRTQDRLMAVRDERVGLINEILQGIRQIKFQSNERYFMNKAQGMRNKELHQLSISYFAYIGIDFGYALAPVAITVVTFGVYAKFIADLTPSKAFTSLVIMNEMRYAINFIPEIIVELISTWTSVKRVANYLESEEVSGSLLGGTETSNIPRPIVMHDTTMVFAGSKDQEDAFKLHSINAEFPLKELSIISGPTGSGKTLLLTGILGEAYIAHGHIDMPRAISQSSDIKFIPADRWLQPNTIAYVAQTAWLENKTIQENILFGSPLVEERYKDTLSACGLTADLNVLEDGDQTEIGEKGINLSGGQKARVSLARAVYSRASVVIMDDVLSALDAHIAKHVFENCINGPLMKERTRILVTHQVGLCLSAASYVLALENGTTKHVGNVSDLRRTGSLQNLIEEVDRDMEEVKKEAEEEAIVKGDAVTQSNKDSSPVAPDSGLPAKKPRKLVDEEAKFSGKVTLATYLRYLRSQGTLFFTALILTLMVVELALTTLGSYWIRRWSSTSIDTSSMHMSILRPQFSLSRPTNGGSATPETEHGITYWVGFYMLIMIASQAANLSAMSLIFWGNVHAGRKLYANMLATIMRAPLRFLDTVPTGRLLNRFSKDAETIDTRMGRNLSQFVKNLFHMLLVLGVCVTVQPLFLLAAVVLIGFGVLIGSQYVSGTRALKRLDSVNRSPMYETFSTTLSGIATIRAYGSASRFMEGMCQKVDNVTNSQFNNMVVNRWLAVRFDTVGNLYTIGMAAFILSRIDTIDAGLAGFTLSFALELQEALLWTIRYYAELEQSMNAVERVFEYTDISTEAAHESEPGREPPAAWPTEGTIEFRGLELKYAPELPSVLHKISFKVRPHEKVGIIGRTGSGKTTITLAIFRFLEAHAGSIVIDGLDIAQMGLHDLRSRLTIVPQEPTLFQGTLRSNLSDDASDEDLRDVLRRVHLVTDTHDLPITTATTAGGTATPASTSANKNVFEDLDHAVTEGGSNFSAGQRQLLCLARALLRRTKIIVMDEATASVSTEIDALIQTTIRQEFVDSTVLTIAHRLDTILDYDRILVLGDGRVLELDTPQNLLRDPKSQFSHMVKAAGLHLSVKK